jgi:hypothetical protein
LVPSPGRIGTSMDPGIRRISGLNGK